MKPMLLVIACIAIIIFAIHRKSCKQENKNKQSKPDTAQFQKIKFKMKDSYSLLPNEVRLYDLMYSNLNHQIILKHDKHWQKNSFSFCNKIFKKQQEY